MKASIAGFLYIAVSSIFFVGFLFLVIAPILFSNGQVDSLEQLIIGGVSLIFGLYSLLLGSAIRRHKKWAWYTGLLTAFFSLAGNIYFFLFKIQKGELLIPMLIEVFILYALFSEKHLYLEYNKEPHILSQQPGEFKKLP
jgi:hypothetical protein